MSSYTYDVVVAKVDGQWKLYCMVQNIEKLVHNGYAP